MYLTILTLDGLVFYLYDPEVGGWHELSVYRKSGLEDYLSSNLSIEGTQYNE